MLLVDLIVLFCLAGAGLAPQAPLGRWLNEALVRRPALWLAAGGGLRLAVSALAVLMIIAFSCGAPEMAALIAVGDLTLWIEVMSLAALAGAGARIRLHRQRLASLARWMQAPSQRARPRSPGPARRAVAKPSRKPDPEPEWAYAFA